MLILRRQPEFLTDVKSFDWIDEDPSECYDLLELSTRRKLKLFKNKFVFKKIHFFYKSIDFLYLIWYNLYINGG